jgi:hypothetical protein
MSNMNTPPKIPADLLARMSGDVNAFHSSVYAQQAQGSRLGSTNVTSFSERAQLDKNRQAVRSYRESAIGNGAFIRHHESTNVGRGVVKPGTRGNGVTLSVKPATFREPPTRPYNPYG